MTLVKRTTSSSRSKGSSQWYFSIFSQETLVGGFVKNLRHSELAISPLLICVLVYLR